MYGNPGITAKERNSNTIQQEKESFFWRFIFREFQAGRQEKAGLINPSLFGARQTTCIQPAFPLFCG
jgi:hypothetical protein